MPSVSPKLPSCGETGLAPGHGGPGLDDDVASVREVIAGTDEPTVVVAHSYGGIVVAEAAAGLSHDAGTFGVRPALFAETFMTDRLDDAPAGLDRLVTQSVSVTGAPTRAAAWHDVPSTYVVCADELGTPAARQREFARKATKAIELQAGHHPFLSQPGAVADIVLTANEAERVSRR